MIRFKKCTLAGLGLQRLKCLYSLVYFGWIACCQLCFDLFSFSWYRRERKWKKNHGTSTSLSLDVEFACTGRLKPESWFWTGYQRLWEENSGCSSQVMTSSDTRRRCLQTHQKRKDFSITLKKRNHVEHIALWDFALRACVACCVFDKCWYICHSRVGVCVNTRGYVNTHVWHVSCCLRGTDLLASVEIQ